MADSFSPGKPRFWDLIIPRLITLAIPLYSLDVLLRKASSLAIVTNDTASYVVKDGFRPPGYPWFIDFVSYFFSNWMQPLVVLQSLCALAAAWLLARSLRNRMRLPALLEAVLFVLLAESVRRWYGSLIGPEIMLYACVLLGLAFVTEGLFRRTLRPFIIAAAIGAVSMLFKTQGLLVFCMAVGGGLVAWVAEKRQFSLKVFLVFCCLCLFAAKACDMVYHKITHNQYGSAITVYHVSGNLLRFAEPQDAVLFASPDREMAADILTDMDAKGYSFKHGFSDINLVLWHTVLSDVEARHRISRGDAAGKIVRALLPKYFLPYCRQIFGDFFASITAPILIFAGLLFLLPGWRVLAARNVMLALVLFACLFNRVSAVPLAVISERYSFVTDSLLLPVFLAAAFPEILKLLTNKTDV